MKNLEAGNRIPLMKSSATWKISLSSVRSGEFSEGMIENDSRGGLSYGSYLKLLLLTEDTETKLLRMMDLIQINMKGSERKDFVLSNLFCGFIVRAQLEKRSICAESVQRRLGSDGPYLLIPASERLLRKRRG